MWLTIFCHLTIALHVAQANTSVDRVRGIPLNRKPLYDPNKDFTCLDGSQTVPFDFVNDDYCDCRDGSDEPGTAACANGQFYCPNLGASPMTVPSSRVNDLICDCCDGSDEWAGHVKCPNLCEELGRRLREDLARRVALHREGFAARQVLEAEAQSIKAEKQKRMDEIKKEIDSIAASVEDLKAKKEAAEKLETEAKDVEYKIWNEARKAATDRMRKKKAESAFDELDVNKDDIVTIEEIQLRTDFDQDMDGIVTIEEATIILGNVSETNRENFVNDIWHRIESYWKPGIAEQSEKTDDLSIPELMDRIEHSEDTIQATPSPTSTTIAPTEEAPDLDTGSDEEEDSDDSEEIGDTIVFTNETRALMEAADKARSEHDELASKKRAMEDDIRDIQRLFELDFGSGLALLPLYKKCYETRDSQYTYRLCLFEAVHQISLNDQHSVSLGHWGKWLEPDKAGSPRQLYEHGQTCWNGPQRTTTVTMECDTETKLKSAMEPSICEYQLVLGTPTACEPPESLHVEHEEL